MHGKTAAELVAEAKSRVETLAPAQVAAELDDGAILIDLREPAECVAHGVIPGAIHAPRGMIEFYADPTSAYHRPAFDPAARVILACASGGRSALAADTLRRMGYARVAHLGGGLAAWREAGYPVEPAPQRAGRPGRSAEARTTGSPMQAKRNQSGCLEIADAGKRASQCCFSICKGKPGKKRSGKERNPNGHLGIARRRGRLRALRAACRPLRLRQPGQDRGSAAAAAEMALRVRCPLAPGLVSLARRLTGLPERRSSSAPRFDRLNCGRCGHHA